MDIYREYGYYKDKQVDFCGSNGSVYINEFGTLDKIIETSNTDLEEKYNKMLKRQKEIEKTTLLLGKLYISNNCRGAVLPYFNNHDKFTKLLSSKNYELIIPKLIEVIDCVDELENSFIYPEDVCNSSNILINRSTGKIELIDLTDDGTDIRDMKRDYKYSAVLLSLSMLVANSLPNISTDRYFNIQTNEELKEFLEFTQKDKVYKKVLK